MLVLLKKEINVFLNSLIGYIAIVVFLLTIGLFMWVIPGGSNILDGGFANIDALFAIAPWVFLFLIPAITMRTFADEKKGGTIELLLTRPLTDLKIILAKYLAGVILVIISLLPTLLYYYSVSRLGNPPENIDTGGMWGSYFGLLFLASAFVAIGVFASALCNDQVTAFILALFLCFCSYTGFEYLSGLDLFGKIDSFILSLGINDHYLSMSRGVIDTRDVFFFVSLIAIFIISTRTVLESRKW
jgi:ABC-2 type transport system permease protein